MTIAETNNKISTVIADMVKTRADINLSNLTSIGNERLLNGSEPHIFEAQKGFITQNVLNDPYGYSELAKNMRSTFDKSKFEIVGDVSINDDGICLRKDENGLIRVTSLETRPGKVEFEWTTPEVFATGYVISGWGTEVYVQANEDPDNYLIYFNYRDENNSYNSEQCIHAKKFLPSSTYNIVFEITDSIIKIGYKLKDDPTYTYSEEKEYTTLNNRSLTFLSSLNMGSIDFKALRVWDMQGQEIFNGNKQGLDVIKEDNYIIFGNPTISEDGVVSGCSLTDYIMSPSSIELGDFKELEIHECFYINKERTSETSEVISSWGPSLFLWMAINTSTGARYIQAKDDSPGVNTPNIAAWNITNIQSGWYNVKYGYNTEGKLFLSYKRVSEPNYTTVVSINTNTSLISTKGAYPFFKGVMQYSSTVNYPYSDPISLNSSIYVDGNLVYQPCLKIPYTLTETGSKVVPAHARERVNQVYEETGEALYWTIDEKNENYTLPKGETYGMVANSRKAFEETGLKTNQITNCILEAPHMVDLELNDGTLTLKKGSKVIVPYGTSAPTMKIGDSLNSGRIVDISWDGSKLFYVVEVLGDISITTTDNATCTLSLRDNGTIQNYGKGSHSGAGRTDEVGVYYNTSTNIVELYDSAGTLAHTHISFPFAYVVADGTGYKSFEYQPQHVGYVGSTTWVMKGVKGLSPDGRNNDGTLRSIIYEQEFIKTYTQANTQKHVMFAINTKGAHDPIDFKYQEVDALPATLEKYTMYYVTPENKWWKGASEVSVTEASLVPLGYATLTSGVISNFSNEQPFQALDRNDTTFIAHQAMPSDRYVDLTLGASGTLYTAPADGYVTLHKWTKGSNQYIQILVLKKGCSSSDNYNNVEYMEARFSTIPDVNLSCVIPVRKGASYMLGYNASGSTLAFRFIYAEGSK